MLVLLDDWIHSSWCISQLGRTEIHPTHYLHWPKLKMRTRQKCSIVVMTTRQYRNCVITAIRWSPWCIWTLVEQFSRKNAACTAHVIAFNGDRFSKRFLSKQPTTCNSQLEFLSSIEMKHNLFWTILISRLEFTNQNVYSSWATCYTFFPWRHETKYDQKNIFGMEKPFERYRTRFQDDQSWTFFFGVTR